MKKHSILADIKQQNDQFLCEKPDAIISNCWGIQFDLSPMSFDSSCSVI